MDLQAVMTLALTLLLHAALILWLWLPHASKTRQPVRGAMQMRLLRLPVRRDEPAKLVIKQIANPVMSRQAPRPRKQSLPATAVAGTSSSRVVSPLNDSPALQLFNPDGSIRMAPTALKLRAKDEANMRHFQQLPCQGTRWSETAERGQNETLGEEFARKYLSAVGLYNKETEAAYQRRRAWLDQACPH